MNRHQYETRYRLTRRNDKQSKIHAMTLIKRGNRIKGFVYEQNGSWWYAFGRPSQNNYIAFACRDKEHGIACVECAVGNIAKSILS